MRGGRVIGDPSRNVRDDEPCEVEGHRSDVVAAATRHVVLLVEDGRGPDNTDMMRTPDPASAVEQVAPPCGFCGVETPPDLRSEVDVDDVTI